MNARLKNIPEPLRQYYDAERTEEIRRKHAVAPETYNDWMDDAADDAGVPRFGEI